VDEREAVRAIGTFGGLKHRMELVGECGGVRFFNDSKSTTAQSAAMAIGAFEAGRVRLICGGYDKKVEMGALAEAARGCACVRTIGATGEAIAGLVGAGAKNVGTLEAAFGEVAAGAREGDVVLLSPGCASWDQFENYESRGEAFRKLVRQWEERVVGASVA
jgi:UDP-N-acetylmuramoylalanine--D-glutamate ligase